MTKLITNAHTAIFQWAKASASSLPTESLRPNPNEFKITKSTPNPLIRTDRDWTELSYRVCRLQFGGPPGCVDGSVRP